MHFITKILLITGFLFIGMGNGLMAQNCTATYYAPKFEGRQTATGEIFRHSGYTAAHKTMAFGTKVKITNKANQKSIVVRVNDRMHMKSTACFDLTKKAANELDMVKAGRAKIDYEVIGIEVKENKKKLTTIPKKKSSKVKITKITKKKKNTKNTKAKKSKKKAKK